VRTRSPLPGESLLTTWGNCLFLVHIYGEIAGVRVLERSHDHSILTGCLALEDNLGVGTAAAIIDDVRKLCWQLLGPPPEKKAEFERGKIGATTAQETPQKVAPAKAKPSRKKPRKKKADAIPESGPMPAKETVETPILQEQREARERNPETPIMQQYREAKKKHPDMVVLFRIGDFFEVFDEDAETLHKLLGLTLTTRDREVTMAGFPDHQLEVYLHKLLKEGQRVAICEPVEESLARGPIMRKVTRVVTSDTAEE
jgi:hypothetical protein